MNKIFTFLVAILLILVVDLLHFDAPKSVSYESEDNITTDAIAASNNNVTTINFGFGFNPVLQSQSNGEPPSTTPGQVFDPVTMLLLGSGLIGLAGLGRKKIQK